ncbi:MAG: MFS transporter [Gemmatimonadaceae bacterium]
MLETAPPVTLTPSRGTPSGAIAAPRYRNPFSVLIKHRNFRIFWFGQTGSLIGTWMQQVALGWVVLQITNSPFLVGLEAAAGSLPVLAFTLFAGVLADRRDKLVLVRITQSLLLLEATFLWWVNWTGRVSIGVLVAIALFGGTASAFDIPTRQSLIIELVGRDDIVDAIALNSSGFNLARIIGPSIAAIVIDRFGLAWCFAVNALSYLLVLISLFVIRLPKRVIEATGLSPTEGLLEGIRFMRKSREVSLLVSLVAVYSIFGIPYLVLMPVIARNTLHGTAGTYGLLLASVGLGAVTGAFALAMIGRRVRRGRVQAAAAFSFSSLLIAFAFSRNVWVSVALLFAIGCTMILNNALANGLLQTITPDHLRGRVMSAYAFVFVGMAPVGSLLFGGVASALGAPAAIGIGGGVLLLFALWVFGKRTELRRL